MAKKPPASPTHDSSVVTQYAKVETYEILESHRSFYLRLGGVLPHSQPFSIAIPLEHAKHFKLGDMIRVEISSMKAQ